MLGSHREIGQDFAVNPRDKSYRETFGPEVLG